MRGVALIRVSTKDQVAGHSLDAQERAFYELCRTRGWEPVKIYREEGRSAHVDSISKRPVFKQLLEDAAEGLFDVVVVHTLDRWARNNRIALESLGILARNNVALVSITENIDYSTPKEDCSQPCWQASLSISVTPSASTSRKAWESGPSRAGT